ncbi:MAG: TetR/AcrR family transcriptional regulator [Solirubrobacteraceae bacterium]
MVGNGRVSSQEGAPGEQDGLAREQLAEIQRGRILSAMATVASEYGVGYASVARVVARSGVSRRTFYEQFEDREDCFLAAFDQAVERIAVVVVPAYRQPPKWRARVRAGLAALLELLEAEPDVARLVFVETLGAGPKALERRRCVLARIIAAVDEGGEEVKRGEAPPPLTAEGLAGGAFSLIHSRMVAGEGAPLVELLNPLVSMIVLPYLGPAAARRELAQPILSAPNGARKVTTDPLRDLDMRLTYRTIRVLRAIDTLGERGSHPSNRQVADAADIRDQGQISKLLTRLQDLDLIANAAHPHAKGEPNAWKLTERGAEVRELVSP